MKDKIDNVITLAVVAIALIWGYSSRSASANEPQSHPQRFVPSGESGLSLDTQTGVLCYSTPTPVVSFPSCSDLAKK